MATAAPDAEPRRIILRRGRGGGFTGGGTGRVESLRDTNAEHDEVDEAIEPNDLNNRVMRLSPPSPAPVSPEDARDNPRSRMNEVAMAGSPTYAKEYRLTLLHRLLLRNTPLDQIARQLQVSISTIEKDRAELKKRLRESAKELNIDEMVGHANGLYDEVQGMALRIASAGGEQAVPTPMKLAAMRTALAANADRTRFLHNAGVFDVLRFRRAEDGSDVSDVQLLMQQTAEMLANMDEPPAPEPRRAVRRTSRPGGFKPMTFDDPDASGSDAEVVDL